MTGMKIVVDYPEPFDPYEALAFPDDKFASIKRTELLSDPVHLPVDGRVIRTKCVFKRYKNLKGDVKRYRARLVFGLDFFGSYAPVARLGTLRIVYALAGFKYLTLASVDVKAAFLYAKHF